MHLLAWQLLQLRVDTIMPGSEPGSHLVDSATSTNVKVNAMRYNLTLLLCLSVTSSLCALRTASAVDIDLDYSHDAYFAANATAKAAVEAAAADISAAITSSLAPIDVLDDTIVGTNGVTSVTFDWHFTYKNPTTGAAETYNPTTTAQDTVTIYVGVQNLTGSTLGQGGPGGAGINLAGGGLESEWVGAMAAAEAQSNAVYGRGGGPTIGNMSGNATLGGTTAFYSLDYGSSIGNLWFDVDSDDNGSQDDAATLEAYWHFDHTTPVVGGKNDLYSVALHELLHSLGIGTADSWEALVAGTTWNGPEAQALNGGSGTDLVHTDGAHLAEGLTSPRLSDGVTQEVVMDPSITVGTRKQLTQMDLAFLRDIGFQTVPEPSTFVLALTGLVGLAALLRRRRRVAT